MNTTTNTHQLNPNAIGLCTLGRQLANKGWLAATGGNLSIRSGEHSCLIGSAHKDKGDLSPKDLLQIDWQAQDAATPSWRASGAQTASAATELHVALYQLNANTKAVLHTNSVAAVVLSRLVTGAALTLQGYAVQQAIRGAGSAEQHIELPLFDHTDHLPSLVNLLQESHHAQAQSPFAGLPYGFLLRGHGLYVWGDSLDEAKRHLEAYEFLIACELERLKIAGR